MPPKSSRASGSRSRPISRAQSTEQAQASNVSSPSKGNQTEKKAKKHRPEAIGSPLGSETVSAPTPVAPAVVRAAASARPKKAPKQSKDTNNIETETVPTNNNTASPIAPKEQAATLSDTKCHKVEKSSSSPTAPKENKVVQRKPNAQKGSSVLIVVKVPTLVATTVSPSIRMAPVSATLPTSKPRAVLLPWESLCKVALTRVLKLVAAEAGSKTNRLPNLSHQCVTITSTIFREAKGIVALTSGSKNSSHRSSRAVSPLPPPTTEQADTPRKNLSLIAASNMPATPLARPPSDLCEAPSSKQSLPPALTAIASAYPTTDESRVLASSAAAVVEGCQAILQAANTITLAFAEDKDSCTVELDEDLLHPIARAAQTAINAIDGFTSPPERIVTEKMVQLKAKRITALEQKREERAQKAKVKEEAERAKAAAVPDAKNQKKPSSEAAVEDTTLTHKGPIEGVTYAPLPLGSEILFSKALKVWAVLVSLPKVFTLGQVPFSSFCTAVEKDDEKGLLLDCVRGLVEATGGPDVSDGKRGHSNWLIALAIHIEECLEAGLKVRKQIVKDARLGIKRKAELQKPNKGKKGTVEKATKKRTRKESETSEDDDEEEDDENDDDEDEDEDDEDDNEETDKESEQWSESNPDDEASDEPAKATEGGEEPKLPEDAVKFTEMEENVQQICAAIRESGSRSSWGCLFLEDRISLLEFLSLHALFYHQNVKVAAETAWHKTRDALSSMDRKIQALRQQANKDIKELRKAKPENFQQKLAARQSKLEKNIEEKLGSIFEASEREDFGTRLRPLGRDRHRRLYWWFPLDRRILVQTVNGETIGHGPSGSGNDDELIAAAAAEVGLSQKELIEMLPCRVDDLRGIDNARSLEWGTPAMAAPTPNHPPPGLFDEEEDGTVPAGRKSAFKKKKKTAEEEEQEKKELREKAINKIQRVWGFIGADQLDSFLASLDKRGTREHCLLKAINPLAPHIRALADEEENDKSFTRMTRSRGRAPQYENRLRPMQTSMYELY